MKKIICTLSVLIFFACNKGVWVTDIAYRAKHPKFSILKQPFKANDLINNKWIYLSIHPFPNFDGRNIMGFVGFYPDGRMIVGSTWQGDIWAAKNSFTNAAAIGYYTTKENTIRFEYFVSFDRGRYEAREGIIKKDTIILGGRTRYFFKWSSSYDTLVVSEFPLVE